MEINIKRILLKIQKKLVMIKLLKIILKDIVLITMNYFKIEMKKKKK